MSRAATQAQLAYRKERHAAAIKVLNRKPRKAKSAFGDDRAYRQMVADFASMVKS